MVVPVVTMVEVPVLSERERGELIASLQQAEADVAAGRAKPFNREEFNGVSWQSAEVTSTDRTPPVSCRYF